MCLWNKGVCCSHPLVTLAGASFRTDLSLFIADERWARADRARRDILREGSIQDAWHFGS